MKKYTQVITVVCFFGFLILMRQLDTRELPVSSGQSIVATPTPAPTVAATVLPTSSTPTQTAGRYTDGTYTGDVVDASYGLVQVQAVVASGKISDVQFLQYPNDNRTSRFVNGQAMPTLIAEAVQAQNAQVDLVSGASATSMAFRQSLQSALDHAQK